MADHLHFGGCWRCDSCRADAQSGPGFVLFRNASSRSDDRGNAEPGARDKLKPYTYAHAELSPLGPGGYGNQKVEIRTS